MLAMYWLISTMATSSLLVYFLKASSILFTDVSARQHGLVFSDALGTLGSALSQRM